MVWLHCVTVWSGLVETRGKSRNVSRGFSLEQHYATLGHNWMVDPATSQYFCDVILLCIYCQGSMQPQSVMMRCTGGSLSDCGTPSPSPISPSLSYSPPSPGFFTDVFSLQQQQLLQQQYLLQQQFEQASLVCIVLLFVLPVCFYAYVPN